MTRLPTIAAIQKAVAAEYGIPHEALRLPRPPCRNGTNRWPISRPRQVAMNLAMRLTEHSLVRVGQLFGGRDHSTVHYACAIIEKRSRTDPELRQIMRRVTLDLVHP